MSVLKYGMQVMLRLCCLLCLIDLTVPLDAMSGDGLNESLKSNTTPLSHHKKNKNKKNLKVYGGANLIRESSINKYHLKEYNNDFGVKKIVTNNIGFYFDIGLLKSVYNNFYLGGELSAGQSYREAKYITHQPYLGPFRNTFPQKTRPVEFSFWKSSFYEVKLVGTLYQDDIVLQGKIGQGWAWSNVQYCSRDPYTDHPSGCSSLVTDTPYFVYGIGIGKILNKEEPKIRIGLEINHLIFKKKNFSFNMDNPFPALPMTHPFEVSMKGQSSAIRVALKFSVDAPLG